MCTNLAARFFIQRSRFTKLMSVKTIIGQAYRTQLPFNCHRLNILFTVILQGGDTFLFCEWIHLAGELIMKLYNIIRNTLNNMLVISHHWIFFCKTFFYNLWYFFVKYNKASFLRQILNRLIYVDDNRISGTLIQ